MKYFTLGKPQESPVDYYYSPANKRALMMGVFYKGLDNFSPITEVGVEAVAAYAGENFTNSDDLSDSASNTAFITDDNNVIAGQAVIQLFGVIRSTASLYGGAYTEAYSLFEGATDAASAKTGFFVSVAGNFAGQPWPFGDIHIWDTTDGYENRQTIRASDFLTGVAPTGIEAGVGFATTSFGVPDAVAETTEITKFEADVGVNSSSPAGYVNLVHILVEGYNVSNSALTGSMINPL